MLFADYTVLVADSKKKLVRMVKEFGRIRRRRKLKVNVVKSKFTRSARWYCMGEEVVEVMEVFKYLRSLVTAAEAEVQQRDLEGSKVLKGRTMSWGKENIYTSRS